MNRHLYTPLRHLTAVGLSAVLLSGCGDSAPVSIPASPSVPVPGTPAPTPKVRFIAFGDAGRANDNQNAVGAAMAQVCAAKGCEFALETGDNFYDAGVSSTTDAQWQTKFELPYKDLNIPFYPTLGNHDNSSDLGEQIGAGEGFSNARGNFQVDYTIQAGTSGRWKLPKRYHSFTAPLTPVAGADPLIEFFCLDSSPLAATLPNPAEVGFNYLTYGPTQMQWFQQGLTNTKARWTIAYAHHPYVSNGSHGNAGTFEGLPETFPGTSNGKPWKDLLDASACAMGLDLFMFGHDHLLEWLKPVPSCNDKTEFILTGAGSDVREYADQSRNPTFFQQDLTQGFFWFEVTANTLTGEAYLLKPDASGALKLTLDAAGKPMPSFVRTVRK